MKPNESALSTPVITPATQSASRWSAWSLIVLSSIILMITMGVRQTVGLLVHPIIQQTNMNIVSVSFALAMGQLMWGVFQPVFGALADKKGPLLALVLGGVLLGLGQIATIWADTSWALMLTLGILAPAGAAAGSFSVLMGVAGGRLAPERRSFASGFINAGGSMGQFLFAPLTQFFIGAWGYFSALWMMALCALATLPLASMLCRPAAARAAAPATGAPAVAAAVSNIGLKQQLRVAFKDRSYLLLHAGFFTCGFHVAFLVTHLPGEVATCGHGAAVSAVSIGIIGLCNIAGSLAVGALGNYYRMKYLLALMYGSRVVMIALYLLAPKTEITFYVFAAAIGLTWLATVPPTAGLVGKLFGMRYLATLFGLTLLTHQVGGFLGAYLGGVAVAHAGNYLWVWYADMALAGLAALVSLPIKEGKVLPPAKAGNTAA